MYTVYPAVCETIHILHVSNSLPAHFQLRLYAFHASMTDCAMLMKDLLEFAVRPGRHDTIAMLFVWSAPSLCSCHVVFINGKD